MGLEACFLYSVSWCSGCQVVPAIGSGWWFTRRAAVPLHSQFRAQATSQTCPGCPQQPFIFAFWTQHDVLHSIRQGCLTETMLSGQICVMSDIAGGRGDLLKPWETSQCAAAMLCSCEHAPAAKRALWPQTRPGTTLGISTAQAVFICSLVGLSIHL